MTKEQFKKNLEKKLGNMIENGDFSSFNAGLKDTPLPEDEESKESKSED